VPCCSRLVIVFQMSLMAVSSPHPALALGMVAPVQGSAGLQLRGAAARSHEPQPLLAQACLGVVAGATVGCRAQQRYSRKRVRQQAVPDKGDFRYTPFRGSGYANWISKQILLGRYPYLEPSRVRDEELGRRRLAELLGEGGVDVFVSLISELPSQEEHGGRRIDGFTGYYDAVNELAKGNDPVHPITPRQVRFLHFPIDDLSAPSMSQLRDIVTQLEKEVLEGRTLYVHCWGGRGRAGTVGACLLGKLEGLTVDEALERVQTQYSAREQDGMRSPETASQFSLINRFFAEL